MDFSIPECVILAAGELLDDNVDAFTIEELTIRCWTLWPSKFGMAGQEKRFPESHKVRYCMMGAKGLVHKGYLDKDAHMTGFYRLGTRGRTTLVELREAWKGGKGVNKEFIKDQARLTTPKKQPSYGSVEHNVIVLMATRYDHSVCNLFASGCKNELTCREALKFLQCEGLQGDAMLDAMLQFEENMLLASKIMKDRNEITLKDGRAFTLDQFKIVESCANFLLNKFGNHLRILSKRGATTP